MYSETDRAERTKRISTALPIISLLMMALLTGCETPQTKPDLEPVVVAPAPVLSAPHLENVSIKDIRFAQIALKQLSYDIGEVDGIWGQRSAKALQEFEQNIGIPSAGGKLSLANLAALNKVTKVRKSDLEPPQPKPVEPIGISSKLNKEPSVEEDDGKT